MCKTARKQPQAEAVKPARRHLDSNLSARLCWLADGFSRRQNRASSPTDSQQAPRYASATARDLARPSAEESPKGVI